MQRRSIFMVLVGAGFVIAGLAALGGRSATPAAAPVQGASQSPVAPTPIVGSQSATPLANASPIANCLATSQLVAVRSVVPATGFPTPIEWIDPGPQAELFFTLSDVAPTILLPAGPVVLTIGLSFSIGGDRYAFTASSATLTYEAATGLVSGQVATGYGKNARGATTDSGPSPFKGSYERTGPGAGGVFSGSIMHPERTFAFRVQMTEKTIQALTGQGCASPRPSDRP